MEDTLGVRLLAMIPTLCVGVLILVLMEDTLGGLAEHRYTPVIFGLNPCFNGRYSRRISNLKK